MDLLGTILSWGEEAPERAAHRSGGAELSYGDLCRSARALAGHLEAELGENRAPLVVLGHKEPEMLIAFLGAALSGRAYAPVDTIVPESRVEQIVETVKAPLVLTPKKIREILAAPKRAAVAKALGQDDPFYIMFTSGSTGQPKGVVITLGCLTDFVDWMLGEQQIRRKGEVFLNQAPFSFDLSIMDLYMSLATGGTLFSVTREEVGNPAVLFSTLRSARTSVWVSTPSFAQLCTQEPTFRQETMKELRLFLLCGETLPAAVARELLDRFPDAEVWNTYGPTEATVATTSVKIDRDILARYPNLPIGRAKPRTLVPVLDENRKPVADGARGEIAIAGPNVALGYLYRPDLTAKAFFEYDGKRAYATGDWGFYKDGLLFCEGRQDSQIKLHGYRIELGDVEANIRKVGGVRDVVVIPKMKNGKADLLAAFVVSSSGGEGDDFARGRELKKKLAETLPAYMIPQRVFFVSAFPMTANGKADRRKLSERLE
jgi:D-alanine--poly(phosphoribitol) ligase subunit 1